MATKGNCDEVVGDDNWSSVAVEDYREASLHSCHESISAMSTVLIDSLRSTLGFSSEKRDCIT